MLKAFAFHELRSGKTVDGRALEGLTMVMSTAEAVSVGYAAAIHGYYDGGGRVGAEHLVQSLLHTAETVEQHQRRQERYLLPPSGVVTPCIPCVTSRWR